MRDSLLVLGRELGLDLGKLTLGLLGTGSGAVDLLAESLEFLDVKRGKCC